ncbi:type IV secretory system conjugative DNA transfer family protein [Arthrobacter cavernae]|uniref:Type IV secretion system DNA-binding domain-containing protein n=1 Tax=Arthrobacter cavernae TaxID=2817681 RepID=A0A939KHZ1_9MICC|nr:type IV secretion system DNA-binding domain-containing protein [Arthrobacter cavernae]MBO1267102.1 type IV secretion system DNA-binding domain-containing protein [Arthrobacter cavernae]
MTWLFLYLTLPSTLFIGVLKMKLKSQAELDGDRKTYVLTFPQDLAEDRVKAWLRSLSGTLHSKASPFAGVRTIVFETWSTPMGIEHRIMVPRHQSDDIMSQLRTHIRGLRYEPATTFPQHEWTYAVEVGESSPERSLRIVNSNDAAASILASLGPLKDNEAVLMQWVVTPVRPERLPEDGDPSARFSLKSILGVQPASRDELADRRKKLTESNYGAVLRVAARAHDQPRAAKLVQNVRTSFTALNSPDNRFIEMRVPKVKLLDRIERAASLMRFPMTLSISELIPLIAYPIGSPMVAGLPRSASRHLPADTSIPTKGIHIGMANFPGGERPVAISWEDITKHMHIAAPTGTGKTEFMRTIGRQIIEAGMGMLLIETKDDLFDRLLESIPRERINDVVVIDLNDPTSPVGFNVLDDGDPYQTIENIESIVSNIHGDKDGVWFKKVVYHALRTLMTRPGATVSDLVPLLQPTDEQLPWRKEIIKNLKEPELIQFWKDLDKMGEQKAVQVVQPVIDRFWHFNSRKAVRNIFGQSTSSLSMADAVAQGKIVLVNVTNIEKSTTKFIASMLISSAWKAVRDKRPDKPFFFMADEVQNLMSLPISLDEMLAQARSYNFPIIMANQSVSQLPQNIQDAAHNNARTKVVFQLESKDASRMAGQFGSSVSEHDLMNLGQYEGVARISTSAGVSPPVTFNALPPVQRQNLGWMVRQASHQNYGRAPEAIAAEIEKRRTAEPTPRKQRPNIGIKPWDDR